LIDGEDEEHQDYTIVANTSGAYRAPVYVLRFWRVEFSRIDLVADADPPKVSAIGADRADRWLEVIGFGSVIAMW